MLTGASRVVRRVTLRLSDTDLSEGPDEIKATSFHGQFPAVSLNLHSIVELQYHVTELASLG